MTDLAKIAERNLRTYLSGVPFRNEVDREAALACVDVLVANSPPQAAGGEPDGYRYRVCPMHLRHLPWDAPCFAIVTEWGKPLPASNDTIEYQPVHLHPPAVGQEWVVVPRSLLQQCAGWTGIASRWNLTDETLLKLKALSKSLDDALAAPGQPAGGGGAE